jgi:putative protein kinase ArgK-like GTPase of G3E family
MATAGTAHAHGASGGGGAGKVTAVDQFQRFATIHS